MQTHLQHLVIAHPANKLLENYAINCKKPFINKINLRFRNQRWSPRGHILKFLALASKVKALALASRPQVLENWPVLGSRTALFFELLKFCGALEKLFFVEIARKIFVKTFFFWRALALVSLVLGLSLEHSCPWPRECLS